MKWIIITLAGGVLVFMTYATYSSINFQLKSSAINNAVRPPTPARNVTVEKVENTLKRTQNQPVKK